MEVCQVVCVSQVVYLSGVMTAPEQAMKIRKQKVNPISNPF